MVIVTSPGLSDEQSLLDGISFDEREATYTGLLLTEMVYKLSSVTVETLTFSYDSNDMLETVTSDIGGETLTFSYGGNCFLSGVVKS